jgi:trk system potassium uptake protein
LAKNSTSRGGIVVIGLGRFGGAVAQSLVRLGHEVLGIDEDADLVQRWSDKLTHRAGRRDRPRRAAPTRHPDLGRAVVGIGTDIEASVLSVLALHELGVDEIWAKAITAKHGQILERTGAHHVVYPEAAIGERVAHLVTGRMIDFIEFDDGFAIAKTSTPREAAGATLADSELRSKYGITVVGIKRPGIDFTYARPETMVEHGDLLIVSGPTNLVEKFAALT